jgi:transmembrane sensor
VNHSDPNPAVLGAAIAWAVRLSSGSASDEEQREFANWQLADPLHQQAWQRVEQQLKSFAAVRERGGTVARKALCTPGSSRRKMIQGSLSVITAMGVSGYLLRRSGLADVLRADLSTDIGHRQLITLADGSAMTLDAHSAVNIDFNEQARSIKLLRGQIFVRVASDATRPLVVVTRDGTASALGTAFCANLSDEGSRIAVTHSKVRVRSVSGDTLVVDTGAVAFMQPAGVSLLGSLNADAEITWVNGYITAVDRPLIEVVAALRPYIQGFVTLSSEAAVLRVTGLFPLDDPTTTIRQIAQTLPVTVTYHTDYLIRIAAR